MGFRAEEGRFPLRRHRAGIAECLWAEPGAASSAEQRPRRASAKGAPQAPVEGWPRRRPKASVTKLRRSAAPPLRAKERMGRRGSRRARPAGHGLEPAVSKGQDQARPPRRSPSGEKQYRDGRRVPAQSTAKNMLCPAQRLAGGSAASSRRLARRGDEHVRPAGTPAEGSEGGPGLTVRRDARSDRPRPGL